MPVRPRSVNSTFEKRGSKPPLGYATLNNDRTSNRSFQENGSYGSRYVFSFTILLVQQLQGIQIKNRVKAYSYSLTQILIHREEYKRVLEIVLALNYLNVGHVVGRLVITWSKLYQRRKLMYSMEEQDVSIYIQNTRTIQRIIFIS